MYLWKCWRDTRSAFFVFLGSLSIVILFYTTIAYEWLGPAGPIAEQTVDSVLTTFFFLMPLTGFVLGSLGVGGEASAQTLQFLLTRPRRRAYFIWSSWSTGAIEVVALWLALTVWMAARPPMPNFAVRIYPWEGAMQVFLRVSVLALLFYSITFFFTVILRKEQNGTTAAVATVALYSAAVLLFRALADVHIPSFWDLYSRSSSSAGVLLGWLAVSVALVLTSSRAFQTREC